MQETDKLDPVTGVERLVDNQVSSEGEEAEGRIAVKTSGPKLRQLSKHPVTVFEFGQETIGCGFVIRCDEGPRLIEILDEEWSPQDPRHGLPPLPECRDQVLRRFHRYCRAACEPESSFVFQISEKLGSLNFSLLKQVKAIADDIGC